MAIQKKKPTPVGKNPAGAKKGATTAKKPNSSKGSTAKPVTKKPVIKKAPLPKRPVGKKAPAPKKSAKPISKPAPARKPAVPAAKKVIHKKLATKKETPIKKKAPEVKASVKSPAKPAVAKKQAVPKPTAKKPEEKKRESPVVNLMEHKKQLKKALKEVTRKKEEPEKPEKPFVMPKTSTEKVRKYEPTFVKSVLDQVAEEESGPTMRYSDPELNEFKDLITRKLETAKKELGYLQGLITRKDEMGGDDTDNRYMTMEDGSLSMEREQLSQMASRQITFIDHLEKALMRIENKTYGICRVTGRLIDKARLRAVPHATLSIEAKMGIAK